MISGDTSPTQMCGEGGGGVKMCTHLQIIYTTVEHPTDVFCVRLCRDSEQLANTSPFNQLEKYRTSQKYLEFIWNYLITPVELPLIQSITSPTTLATLSRAQTLQRRKVTCKNIKTSNTNSKTPNRKEMVQNEN